MTPEELREKVRWTVGAHDDSGNDDDGRWNCFQSMWGYALAALDAWEADRDRLTRLEEAARDLLDEMHWTDEQARETGLLTRAEMARLNALRAVLAPQQTPPTASDEGEKGEAHHG